MKLVAFKLAIVSLSLGLALAAPPIQKLELLGPDQLSQALSAAKRITFTGRLPITNASENPGKRLPIVGLPCVLERIEDIKQLSEFFRDAKLQDDPEMTKAFQEGETLSSAIAVKMIIDDKFTLNIIASDLLVFRGDLTCRAHGYDGRDDTYFSRELALFLARVRKASQ